jgi:hypothetical protein
VAGPAEDPHLKAQARPADDLFSFAIPSDACRGTFDLLLFDLKHGWLLPSWLMLSLSAEIATLGLSQNSVATVIGAMIVAPLGQPRPFSN